MRVIDENLVVPMLLIDNWDVHHVLDRDWHKLVNNLFGGAVRGTPLWNDLWDMNGLLYHLVHWLVLRKHRAGIVDQ